MMLIRAGARHALVQATILLGYAAVVPLAAQQPPGTSAEAIARAELEVRYTQPPAPIAQYFAGDPSFATLDAPSPDGRYFVVPRATELSTLELMSRPTLRLAELEIRPETDRLWHLDTYGIVALRIFDVAARAFRDVQLPRDAFVSDIVWSPNGERVAFLAHVPGGTEVWTADAASGRASRLSDARILATLATSAQTDVRPSRMLQWTPEGSILTLMVPADRGREPARSPVPAGPVMRQTRPDATPTRTFPNLLRDAHDAALFRHYTRAQLVELVPGRAPRALGEPRMYESIAVSPDGRHVLATHIDEPFSLITSHQGFPRRTVVLDRAGTLLANIEDRALREGSGRRGDDDGGRRGLAWRPDGAGLSFLERAEEGGDRVMLLPPPFGEPQVVATSEDPIRSVGYSRDGRNAFGTVTRDGQTALVRWAIDASPPAPEILVDFHATDDPTTLPGEYWTQRLANGTEYVLVSSTGDAVYLHGAGLKGDFRPQPFVDRVALADGSKTRLFEGSRDLWERPIAALDADMRSLIVRREASDVFPDSWLRAADGVWTNLTNNVDPFPELTAARRADFSFTRSDGIEVQARISLPLGYRDGDKVPAIFWTYPREYTTSDAFTRATIQSRNHNAFTPLTWLRWSDLWLTQGYALVYPDIPIIGENYNDSYIAHLRDAMYGALRAVDRLGFVDMDRIGHGGHSYGAFATANLLAHTPFFKAGIAGAGAYNRSLTPTGFQAEPRDIWNARQTYLDMSPFFNVHQINAPLLMYHGADDNNTGTWPLQSERLMHALTSLGKNAALFVYPYESHTPRAIENNLDMWARWIAWFDRYVKGAPDVAADGNGGL
jgi:dipeptidyl aminopeptidase/acylaminoacyl peptidase